MYHTWCLITIPTLNLFSAGMRYFIDYINFLFHLIESACTWFVLLLLCCLGYTTSLVSEEFDINRNIYLILLTFHWAKSLRSLLRLDSRCVNSHIVFIQANLNLCAKLATVFNLILTQIYVIVSFWFAHIYTNYFAGNPPCTVVWVLFVQNLLIISIKPWTNLSL